MVSVRPSAGISPPAVIWVVILFAFSPRFTTAPAGWLSPRLYRLPLCLFHATRNFDVAVSIDVLVISTPSCFCLSLSTSVFSSYSISCIISTLAQTGALVSRFVCPASCALFSNPGSQLSPVSHLAWWRPDALLCTSWASWSSGLLRALPSLGPARTAPSVVYTCDTCFPGGRRRRGSRLVSRPFSRPFFVLNRLSAAGAHDDFKPILRAVFADRKRSLYGRLKVVGGAFE